MFDDLIKSKLGDSMPMPPSPLVTTYIPYSDCVEPESVHLPEDNDPVNRDNNAIFEKPITDCWIHTELNLPQGEELRQAKVIGRSNNEDGSIVGTYDDQPNLSSLAYDIEFMDGKIYEYSANVITENMYSQVDANEHSYALLDSILDFSKDAQAVEKAAMHIYTKSR